MLTTKRYTYLDFLRIIACFFVIFNHQPGYIAFQDTTNIWQAFYYMGYTMFTRINIPLFFMISGALLLPKTTSYKELFGKRILRIVLALTIASFVWYLVSIRKDFSSFDFIYFVRKLLNGTHYTTYWYLYAYLGFLVTLPLLQRLAKGFTHADFICVIGIHFVFSTLLPLFNYVLVQFGISKVLISSDFSVPLMITKAFFYPLMGYYVEHVFDINKLTGKTVWILPCVIVGGILISSIVTYHEGITSGYTQNYVQTFDYTTTIALFLLVKYLFVKVKAIQNCSWFHRAVALISSLTLGIYLMEPVLKVTTGYFSKVVPATDPIFYSFVWCIYAITVCGIVTFLLKKIPVIKKLL